MMERDRLSVWFLSIIMISMVGCVSTPVKKELIFNALIFDNQSGSELENVRIEVRKTGVFASCGVILSGTACSTTFRTKIYQGNPVYISWQVHGQKRAMGPLYVELPQTIQYDVPARIRVSFKSENDVTAKFSY
ncbi:MAG: hypothetical protein ACI9U1_002143 [Porticoccaceae bacterium]|jgi:hypothetical protein